MADVDGLWAGLDMRPRETERRQTVDVLETKEEKPD